MRSKKQGGRSPVYENSFKVAIAREYLTGNQGYGAIAVKYGLGGPHTVRFFVKWYQREYGKTDPASAPQPDEVTVNEAALLAIQLEEANLKIAGLEMLIEVAKKELGVDVKKFGAKQSPK